MCHNPLHPGNVSRKAFVILMILGYDTREQVAVRVIGSTRGVNEGWKTPSQQNLSESCSKTSGANTPSGRPKHPHLAPQHIYMSNYTRSGVCVFLAANYAHWCNLMYLRAGLMVQAVVYKNKNTVHSQCLFGRSAI